MSVKILIKRKVPMEKEKELQRLLKELRSLSTKQPGYISGETLRRVDKPDEYLVISTWESSEDWHKWMMSVDRKNLQAHVDLLLGKETEYEMYQY